MGKNAFYGCSAIATVNTSDLSAWCGIEFENSSSTPVYYAKALTVNGSKITSLTIPSTITVVGDYAFYNNTAITSLTIPEGVTTIGAHTFNGCSGLTTVTLPKSLASVGDSAFSTCLNLKTVKISDMAAWCAIEFASNSSNPTLYAYALTLNGSVVTDLVIPEGVTSIGKYAFYYCTGLTSVTIPSSVKSIGGSAFYYPSSVTPAIATVKISDVAAWCAIDFAGGNANPVYYAKSLTLNGTALTNLVIPEGVTTIGFGAFRFAEHLTSITIPKTVTKIENVAFQFCYDIVEFNFGGTTTDWENVEKLTDWDKYCGSLDYPLSGYEYIVKCTDGDITVKK